jgi:ferredoxin-type protein NapH
MKRPADTGVLIDVEHIADAPLKKTGKKYRRIRLAVLTGAFLLIAVNPILNYFLHNHFLQGWYQSLSVGKLWFVSPLEGFESLLLTKSVYLPAIIGMVIPVGIALVMGRVFCSWICPVSLLLELFDGLRRAITRRSRLRNRLLVAKKVLWFTLLAELVVSMVLGAPIFVFLSPPGLIGRELMMAVFFRSLAIEGLLLVLIVALEFLTRRFFCRSFCPLGGLLAFLGIKRKLRVHVQSESCTACGRCAGVCPMGLQPSLDEGLSAYCWNCGDCVDCCRHDALTFRWS